MKALLWCRIFFTRTSEFQPTSIFRLNVFFSATRNERIWRLKLKWNGQTGGEKLFGISNYIWSNKSDSIHKIFIELIGDWIVHIIFMVRIDDPKFIDGKMIKRHSAQWTPTKQWDHIFIPYSKSYSVSMEVLLFQQEKSIHEKEIEDRYAQAYNFEHIFLVSWHVDIRRG